jgi:GT2 family glycosyltransferase
MEFPSEVTYSITFVEYSIEMEHKNLCDGDVNYINVPFGGYFNKCLAFNVGALFSNKAKYFLFHDLDIMVKKDFFKNIFKNLERTGTTALQPFRLRRVLYCNENLSRSMINGQVSINELHTKYPGITEPNLPEQMRAPGGSIFCPKEQFVAVGGYDPELFFGYSIEDQFFYDKLSFVGGIESCNDPGIEVFHLYHPPLWSSNPFLTHHHNIYLEFSKIPLQDKKAFYDLERTNIEKHIR